MATKKDEGKMDLSILPGQILLMIADVASEVVGAYNEHIADDVSSISPHIRKRILAEETISFVEKIERGIATTVDYEALVDVLVRYHVTEHVSRVDAGVHLLRETVRAMEYGANKYTRGNWRQGFLTSRLTSAMLRHAVLYNYLSGESYDTETKTEHTGNIAFSLGVLLQQRSEYTVPVPITATEVKNSIDALVGDPSC